jgi:hypothetical protein
LLKYFADLKFPINMPKDNKKGGDKKGGDKKGGDKKGEAPAAGKCAWVK